MKTCIGWASILVPFLALSSAAAPAFDPHCGSDRVCQVWAQYRSERPFPHQAFAFGKAADGTLVLIISEPPAVQPKKELEKLVRTAFGSDFLSYATRRWAVGVDGWLEDVVVQLKPVAGADPLQDPVLKDRIGFLHSVLFGTAFGVSVEAANAKYGGLARNLSLDVSLSPVDLRRWVEHPKGDWTALDAPKQAHIPFQAVLNGQRAGAYLDGERQLVVLSLPHRVLDSVRQTRSAAKDLRLTFRRFAVASDLVLGAVWNKSGDLAIVARSRRVSQAAVAPLRFETFVNLVCSGDQQLVQSYERTNVFAGRLRNGPHNGLDWAPVLLSPQLIDTEFGVLLDVTDQLLKSWSEAGAIDYLHFNYPLQPPAGRFVFGSEPLSGIVHREMGGNSVLFNWNTAGASVAVNDGGLTTLAAGRTGALPVTYGADAAGSSMQFGLPKLRTREDAAFAYFAAQRDPNLARVVSYTLVYQALHGALAESGARARPSNPPPTAATQVLVRQAESFLSGIEMASLRPRPGADAAAFQTAMIAAQRALGGFYSQQHIDRPHLAALVADPQSIQALQNQAAAPVMSATDKYNARVAALKRRLAILNRTIEAHADAVNEWLRHNAEHVSPRVKTIDDVTPYLQGKLREKADWIAGERFAIRQEDAAIAVELKRLDFQIGHLNAQMPAPNLSASVEALRGKLGPLAQMCEDLEGIRAAFVKSSAAIPGGSIKTPSIVLSRNSVTVSAVGGHNISAGTVRIEIDPRVSSLQRSEAPDGSTILRVPSSKAAANASKIARALEHDRRNLGDVAQLAQTAQPARASSAVLGKATFDPGKMDGASANAGRLVGSPERANLLSQLEGDRKLSAAFFKGEDQHTVVAWRDGETTHCCLPYVGNGVIQAAMRESLRKGPIVILGSSERYVSTIMRSLASEDSLTQAELYGIGRDYGPKLGAANGATQLVMNTSGGRFQKIAVYSKNLKTALSVMFKPVNWKAAERHTLEGAAARRAVDGDKGFPQQSKPGESLVIDVDTKTGIRAEIVVKLKPGAPGSNKAAIMKALDGAYSESNLAELLAHVKEFVSDKTGEIRIRIESDKLTFRVAEDTTVKSSRGSRELRAVG